MRLIYLSITLQVICALFIGLTIIAAFADALEETDLSRLIASLFVLAMIAFIASLMVFLREISLAVRRTLQKPDPGSSPTATDASAQMFGG